MNTRQIKNILEHHPITKKYFCGVFVADEIPKSLNTFPCGFVVNTDPSSKPGTHWVVFYFISKENGEFFDSYGKPPRYYKDIFKPSFETLKWNKRVLQSHWIEVCGQYCIFYLYQRCRGYTMNEIVNMFTDNTSWNDCDVACYVKKNFNVIIFNQPVCGLNQCLIILKKQ